MPKDDQSELPNIFSGVGLFLKLIPYTVLFLGVLVLFGWQTNIVLLTRINQSFTAMNPATAVGFIMLSISLLFRNPESKSKNIFSTIIAIIMAVLGGQILLFKLLGFGFSLDTILFAEKVLGTPQPSLLAPVTALMFVISGVVVALSNLSPALTFQKLARFLAFIILSISVVSLGFYVLRGITALETPNFFNIAIHTGVLFTLISTYLYFTITRESKLPFFFIKFNVAALLLLVFVPIWILFIAPTLNRIPSDFTYSAQLISIDNFYDKENSRFLGESRSDTLFFYKAEKSTFSDIIINGIYEVKKPNGEIIISTSKKNLVDRFTRQNILRGEYTKEGYILGPQNVNKNFFTYSHITFDKPSTMKFEEEESIIGFKVYRYSSKLSFDQTKDLESLPEVGETLGVVTDTEITIWLDPLTGHVVNFQDKATSYFYDLKSGSKLYPRNMFSNSFSTDSVIGHVREAEVLRQKYYLLYHIIPSAFGLLALILLLVHYYRKYRPAWVLYALPTTILVGGIVLSVIVWYLLNSIITKRVQTQFEVDALKISEDLGRDLNAYENLLIAVKAHIGESITTTSAEWSDYVDSLQIGTRYPGTFGLGFAGGSGENSSTTRISHIAPRNEINDQLLGFDLNSNPEIARMLNYSRANNSAAITKFNGPPNIDVVDTSGSYLIAIPSDGGFVFSKLSLVSALRGYVSQHGSRVYMEIIDRNLGGSGSDEIIFKSEGEKPEGSNIFSTNRNLSIFGRSLVLRFQAYPNYTLSWIDYTIPNISVLIIMILTVLVTTLVTTMSISQEKVTRLAASMVYELNEKTKTLEIFNKELSGQIKSKELAQAELQKQIEEIKKLNNLMVGRELKMIELKEKLQKLQKHESDPKH